ncbi:hypothetical protein [Paracoccus sp. (in: a-proteobacteria)]|uniref:hypothetical protein n=1 Tax=Paracoccus sp. TaxID=267 RepID=UPI00391B518D
MTHTQYELICSMYALLLWVVLYQNDESVSDARCHALTRMQVLRPADAISGGMINFKASENSERSQSSPPADLPDRL